MRFWDTGVQCRFLSTLSLRRATAPPNAKEKRNDISIHALLAESDWDVYRGKQDIRNFYPRSPCGERRNGYPHTRQRDAISIHALLAESDWSDTSYNLLDIISIHALLAESDTHAAV